MLLYPLFAGREFMERGILSVAAWYDNEWGFANRLAQVAAFMASKKSLKSTQLFTIT
jgi:glyceraldehyde-3-phosphate dehydrogenase/erythrose-4-phosphate dehydrogenase